jgi:hypothetical protein
MAINPGQGTILHFGASGLSQVVEVDGPEATVETKSTVNLSSTKKTYRALLPDGGTVSATIQYDPADLTHQALTTAINAWPQAPTSCSVVFNTLNTSTATFSAILVKFKPKGMNEEDNLEAEIELKITGTVTWPTS